MICHPFNVGAFRGKFPYTENKINIQMVFSGAEEMICFNSIRVLVALANEPGSVPSIPMMAHNHSGDLMIFPALHGVRTYMYTKHAIYTE